MKLRYCACKSSNLSFLNKLNDVPSTFAKHFKFFLRALHVDSPAVHREVLGIGVKTVLCCLQTMPNEKVEEDSKWWEQIQTHQVSLHVMEFSMLAN